MNAVVLGLVVGLNTLAYFHYHGNPHVAGFLFGALGVGALIGAIVAGPLGYIGAGLALEHVSVYVVFFAVAAILTVPAFAFAGVLLRNRAATDVAAVPDVAHG